MGSAHTDPANWKYTSPEGPGLHTVITPENSACRETWMYRLNLPAGETHQLASEQKEFSVGVVAGAVSLTCDEETHQLGKLDSFYLPGKTAVSIRAEQDAILYLGAGPYEGIGEFFVRKYDPELPLGEIRQVHGEPPYRRDVFMTTNQEVPGSRLICGWTWGEPGKWTSWPPHQHSEDLEEVYAYFDVPAPHFALQLVYTQPGQTPTVHAVSSGDMVVVPEGYHPTVGCPGVRSCYFWVMVAHSHESRRYDLAVNDPNFTSQD